VRRMHGGVAHVGVEETPYRERIVQQHAQKQAIARAAARLIQPGWTIYLSPGTTTTEIARVLPKTDLTVVTNSLPIAQELMTTTDLEIVLTGGHIRRHAEAMVGEAAEASISKMFINLAFVGATGLDMEAGLSVYSESEAQVLLHVLRASRKTVVVADSSKWGKVMGPSVVPLPNIHALISDPQLPRTAVDYLEQNDVSVTLARHADA